MSRISRTFANLSEKSQKALIAYIMAGDPSLDATYPAVKALRSAGVDIIELGFPFSDPLADGPTIQAAAYRALQNPIGLDDYFRLIQRVRAEDDVPLILMTYYNVIYHYGLEAFAKTAGQAGLDGIIIPDLPLEES
ncbi:MAG TPA: tryptophan synthase subunit alpha, partial [bacterium]|nr:tryptophan synthase subunit alpha [bacterium]